MNRYAAFGLLACSLILVGKAQADNERLSPFVQELLLSHSGDNQELGEWQLSLAGQYSKLEQDNISTLSAELEYGITSRLTLGVEMPYSHIAPEHGDNLTGWGNLEVSALYRLLDDDDYYVSLAIEKSFDTGAETVSAFQEDAWELDLVYLTQITATQQYKISLLSEFEDDETTYQVAAAWLQQLDTIATAIELKWYNSVEIGENPHEDDSSDHSDSAWQLAFNGVWQYANDQEIQLGIPIGLSDGIADWGFVVKWSVEWE